jgi:hypothetical protein
LLSIARLNWARSVFFPLDLQLRLDRPHVARPQRRLGTDQLSLVPRLATSGLLSSSWMIVFHGWRASLGLPQRYRPEADLAGSITMGSNSRVRAIRAWAELG